MDVHGVSGNRPYGQIVVIPCVCMLVLLAMLAWGGARLGLQAFVASWFILVAIARLRLWRGRKPALAASVGGVAMGVALMFFIIPAMCYGPGALDIPSLTHVLVGNPQAIAWYISMLGAVLVFAAFSYVAHLLLSGCECVGELAGALYSAWRTRQPLAAAIPRRRAVHVVGAAFFIAAVAASHPIVQVKVWSLAGRAALSAAMSPPRRSDLPVVEGLMRLQFGSQYHARPKRFYELYLSCRDRLVAAGTLVHRRFVFTNVEDGTAEAAAVLEAVVATFPQNVHIGAPYNLHGGVVLDVYAKAGEVSEWDRFVRHHDKPPRRKKD